LTVWNHWYSHDEPVGQKDVSAVEAALDRNVHRGLDEVAAALEEHFNSVNTDAPGLPR